MDFTLTDNGDGTFTLTDADRAALQDIATNKIVLVPDFKGVTGHLVRLIGLTFDSGMDYDPQAAIDKANEIIAEQQKIIATMQPQAATQAKLQTNLAQSAQIVP